MNKNFVLLVFLLLVISCNNEGKNNIDLSGIDVAVNIDRFDKKFYNATPESLLDLKNEYPFLFPTQNHDSIWLNRINNSEEIELFEKANELFDDFTSEKLALEELFRHIKYYYSDFQEPKIITLITNLDYESNVMYTKNFLFISLDMYLGNNSEIYSDFPVYLSQNFKKSQLMVDIGSAISDQYLTNVKSRQFIDLIINEGKKMYQLDCFLPAFSDAQKMGYSEENLNWANANETPIWKYFMEQKLLYSTDSDLYTRFIANAPFSKFYIDIDKESPGRIGVWLGWQIVRSYMTNNNVTLQQLLDKSPEEIFKNSKYKPKK